MLIRGNSVILRAPEPSDARLLHEWSNDPDIWRLLGGWHFPFSTRSTEDWIKTRMDNNLGGHVFCIDAPGVGLIGTANLVEIDWKNGTAFHGLMIGPDGHRGKGYAKDALFALMRYAFMELRLERLDSDIIGYNARSLRFYTEKCGWVKEGVRRKWFYREGVRHDKILIGITRDDYLAMIDKNEF